MYHTVTAELGGTSCVEHKCFCPKLVREEQQTDKLSAGLEEDQRTLSSPLLHEVVLDSHGEKAGIRIHVQTTEPTSLCTAGMVFLRRSSQPALG